MFVGNGQPLVLGSERQRSSTTVHGSVRSLAAHASPCRRRAAVDISRNVSGGTLGGLLDFRSEQLDPARNALGRIGVALTDVVNYAASRGHGPDRRARRRLLRSRRRARRWRNGPTPAPARSPRHAHERRRADRPRLHSRNAPATGWALRDSPGHGAAVPHDRHRHGCRSVRRRRPRVVVGGTADVGDTVPDPPDARRDRGHERADHRSVRRSPRPRRSAPRRDTANTGTGTISAGEVLDSDQRAAARTVNIEFTSRDHVLDQRRRQLHVHDRRSTSTSTAGACRSAARPPPATRSPSRDNTGGTGDNRNALRSRMPLKAAGARERHDLARLGGRANRRRHRRRHAAGAGQAATRRIRRLRRKRRRAAKPSRASTSTRKRPTCCKYQQAYQAAAQMIRSPTRCSRPLLNGGRRRARRMRISTAGCITRR